MKQTFFQRIKFRAPLKNIETILGMAVVVFGLLLRLRQYTLNLSLWLDEAMLALNIVQRSFGELVRPLDYDQGAPLGFLWLTKLVQVTLGNNEYSLRLMPFIAGCVALIAFWFLARKLTGPVGGIFAMLILASSRHIVSFSAQVKQYSVDLAITLLLYLAGLYLLRKTISNKEYLSLAVLGALSIWISHAAVFTLGALGMVLIISAGLHKKWHEVLRGGLVSLFWALNFGLLYLIQYRSLGENTFLTGYWQDYFLPLSISAPQWTLERLSGLLYNPGGFYVGVPMALILVLFFGGLISFIQKRESWGWVFVLSLVLTLAASALEKYPFGGRMGMFLLPGLLICIGEGLELLRRLFSPRPLAGFFLAMLLAGFMFYTPLTFSIELAVKPKVTENITPTMTFLKNNYRPDDKIYLYRWSIPAFRYYAPKYDLENAQVIDGSDFHLDRTGYLSEMKQLAGNKRVWLLFSHLTDYDNLADRDAILAYISQLGDKKREFSEPGTAINLYLFDLAR